MTRKVAALLVAVVVLATVGATPAASLASPAESVDSSAPFAQCGFPVSMTDATGTEVSLEQEPQRVVTLGPAAAQTLVEIGAGDKIVGATKFANFLEGSEDWADVSGSGQQTASVEKVIAQNPDLVLAENIVGEDTVSKLRQAGITVYKFRRSPSLEFVYEKVHKTGRLVGASEAAADVVAEMQYDVAVARTAAEGKESPTVLYPFYGYTTGSETFQHAVITAAGGTNVAAEAGLEGFKPLSDEIVANATVSWLMLQEGQSPPARPAYNGTIAVQMENYVYVNPNNISQPAPRITTPIAKLSKAWHPRAYEDATDEVSMPEVNPPCAPDVEESTTTSGGEDGTATTDAGTEMGTGTAADTTTAGDTGGSPGFGAGAAGVALLVAAFLFRRR
jgi:iron complex transport system substrate-binding protein